MAVETLADVEGIMLDRVISFVVQPLVTDGHNRR